MFELEYDQMAKLPNQQWIYFLFYCTIYDQPSGAEFAKALLSLLRIMHQYADVIGDVLRRITQTQNVIYDLC